VSGFLGLVPLETGEGGEGYQSPGVSSFDLPPLFEGAPEWVNKYLFMAVLSVIVIAVLWVLAARQNKMVPGKAQFIGETAYMFIRNSLGRDMIGHDFRRYVPLLVALFSFVLINNLWGIFPLFLLPTASHAGWAYGLAILVWVIYNAVGIGKHGFFGYLKHTVLPSGVPKWMWPLIIPLEFFSNIIVRPATLSLRLFANMLAGHLLVLLFVLGGEYLLFESEGLLNKAAGVVSLLFSLVIFGLELFVQSLQAYIFTVLTAQYIGSAAAEEH
jgi:F-type H+-transporting ATPase subunit a